jgi:hypothetical protein
MGAYLKPLDLSKMYVHSIQPEKSITRTPLSHHVSQFAAKVYCDVPMVDSIHN